MLAIGRALMGPAFSHADEPSLGIAPKLIRISSEDRGRSTGSTPHDPPWSSRTPISPWTISHHAYVLGNGRIAIDGTPNDAPPIQSSAGVLGG